MIACRPWRIAPFGQNSWQQKQWMQTPRSICGFFFFIVIALAGFSFTCPYYRTVHYTRAAAESKGQSGFPGRYRLGERDGKTTALKIYEDKGIVFMHCFLFFV